MHVLRPLLIIALSLAFTLPGATLAASQPITDGWEYRWGDSTFNADGQPHWTLETDAGQWQTIGFPSNPPDRNGREHVWYRVTLPNGEWQEPVLYIFSVDIIVQVYLGGEQIYEYGTFDSQGRGSFQGWPWHAIALPAGYQDKPIYFRVFSDYTDIGLWGEVSIMDQADLVLFIVENSLKALVIAGFSALIALLALIFAALQTERRTFLGLAVFALSAAVMLVAESQASLLITYRPLMWDYLAAGSYYMLPVALALMLEQWLADYRPWLIGLIWKLHLGYLVGAIGLALLGVVNLSSTFPVFDALFLATIAAITVVVVRRFRHMVREQQVLVLTYGIFCGFLIVDMAVAHGVLPWGRVPVSWGLLMFTLAVVVISLWHYASTQNGLKRLAVSLEQKVEERTARAESLARREQARVRMLTFENEKNRVLGDMIADLQDCLTLEQAFPVLAKVVPDLCSPLPGILYQRGDDGHYRAVVCWGDAGEQNALPQSLDASRGLPRPSQVPEASGNNNLEAAANWPADPLCFWINVESASEGIVTEGVLLLESVGLVGNEERGYGLARLFTRLDQAIQRISITLSSIALREELQKFSYEDALTGLKNRRYFDQLFEHECAVALRSHLPLSLLVIDIDHFKQFNDTHGHEAGDRGLQSVALTLQRQFRDSDIVCRYGGEEFVVIMPGALTDDATERAQSLCDSVSDASVVFQGQDLGHLTVSVGVACWPETGEAPEQLLSLADQALYRAKEEGRNRVGISRSKAA
ncbi:GGDEF domain-containing protein [Marinobacter arenosus]|uniref:GGDEF domain-containing protein n=1 Tax=Marinobacter arenosus TaxID=2856822 RepID=UPI001C4D1D6F|nr:GGDEF domain-containing protein [Marinobacter arenosus]MBW0148456.1 GGDEF domain-containing protein [Marinobacter arenosus]